MRHMFRICICLSLSFAAALSAAEDADARSAREVRTLFGDFNRAWERRDMKFVNAYFAHDSDMLLFFERRQLTGWSKVETLYKNMFANAGGAKVRSTVSNVTVKARGDMAWLAANFRLEVTHPDGKATVDEGRQTVVYERRGGRWIVVHRHTSFQAPPGPQQPVPLHTEPGPLWDKLK
ncbi:MAG: SgcJ/EcaC family oxidoreductase [Bryobacteraceae bacterium]